jgi:hypothetical protein
MKLNPFPDYPVSRLDENSDRAVGLTAATDPIRQERDIISNWLNKRTTPLIVAVRGDYGSGKTHLLLDAMANLSKALDAEQPSFLRVATVAAPPLGWYRTAIGPRLTDLPLKELVVQLYAKAGIEVAARAELTEPAVARLNSQPGAIKNLVSRNLLSSTAVEEVFQRKLREALPNAPDDVVLALGLLRWDTVGLATDWLAGRELAEEQARLVKLPRSIDSDEGALEALLAVAALHRALDRTFALFVDEAEHFLRVDRAGSGNPNATTMKRLLEGLAKRGAIVFVAGYWSAWEALPDYLDRFSPSQPIDLLRLTPKDVQNIVAARTVETPELDSEQATLVADLSLGNMRTTMSLLRELFEVSGGFERELSLNQITETAESLRRRPPPDVVLLQVHELLELLGFSVARDERILVDSENPSGIPFDLVASRSGRPRVLVELRHPSHELAQGDQVRRMVEQMRDVNQVYTEAIGCFLSETRLDQAVRDTIPRGSARRVLLSDVTKPDFISALSSQLTPLLQASDIPATPEKLASASKSTVNQISQLRSEREQELDHILSDPPSAAAGQTTAARESNLSTPRSDYRDRLVVTYEELTRPTPLTSRLAHTWRPLTLGYVFIMGLGLAGTIFTAAQGAMITGTALSYGAIDFVQYLASIGLIVIGALMISRDIIHVERFYEYRNSRLRSIYLRTEDVDELIRVNDQLQEALDLGGPRWSRILRYQQSEDTGLTTHAAGKVPQSQEPRDDSRFR